MKNGTLKVSLVGLYVFLVAVVAAFLFSLSPSTRKITAQSLTKEAATVEVDLQPILVLSTMQHQVLNKQADTEGSQALTKKAGAQPLTKDAVTKEAVKGPKPLITEAEGANSPIIEKVTKGAKPPSINEAVPEGERGEPMVLSLSYWEQSANALSNLIDLQCWARTANISKVVEPSVTPESDDKSVLHFTGKENYLRLGDLVNISHWDEVSIQRNFCPLVSLEYFLKHATKDFVYVHVKYAKWPTSCETKAKVAGQEWYKFLMARGFRLKKTVCIDFTIAPSNVMSEESFQDQIFQDVSHNVTILFHIWRGIRKTYRIALNKTRCLYCFGASLRMSQKPTLAISYSQPHFVPLLVPSPQMLKFLDQFMSKHLSGDRYVAVMLRTEKLSREIISIPPGNNSCASEIHSDWKKIADSNNITQTLFFSDIGGHGSMKWNNIHALEFSQYVQHSLHLTLSLQQMNSVLEGITGSRNSVQVAYLHQQLVARATCVVVVGGGGFQSQTLHVYSHFHEGQECYAIRGGQCKSSYIEHVYG